MTNILTVLRVPLNLCKGSVNHILRKYDQLGIL